MFIPAVTVPPGVIAAGFLNNANGDGLYANSWTLASEPITMGCWTKLINHTTAHTMMAIADSTDQAGHFVMRAANLDGDIIARKEPDSGAQASNIDGHATINPGGWYYTAATFEATNRREGFVNGMSHSFNTQNKPGSVGDRLSIGNTGHATGETGSTCWIAMPCVWSVALTAPELLQLYHGADPKTIRPDAIEFLSYDMRNDYRDRFALVENTVNIQYGPFTLNHNSISMNFPAAVVATGGFGYRPLMSLGIGA